MNEKRKGRRSPVRRGTEAIVFSFESPEFIPVREAAAQQVSYPHEWWFEKGLSLAYRLFTARVGPIYTDDLPKVLTYLCVKALNDLLAAVRLVKNGYHHQSWPLLRGALEAAELMDYFNRNPDEIIGWLDNENRFLNLAWLRDHLTHTEHRHQFFDILNESTHANIRTIATFSTLNRDAAPKLLVVGPLPVPPIMVDNITIAANLISYPVRVLWQSDKSVASPEWTEEFHLYDGATGYLFGQDWNPSGSDDLVTKPPMF